ncbi:MAG: hypothetical protein HFI68_02855 [Lachnospiraceae bacterium]|nr:hypothetical protein [Lachnospiraceae bacterium]
MIKTLRLSFALKNTYRVNGILYAIRQIPVIKKIVPAGVYQVRGFKIFANVLSVIWEVVTVFLGKLLYFLLMINGVMRLYDLPPETDSRLFLHLLLFLSAGGALLNTYMFNPTKDKYYAMILLGMDAKSYTLVNYFYALLKVIAGFGLCSFLFAFPRGCSLWQCLLIPFFVAGVKMSVSAYALWDYEKKGTVRDENKLSKYSWGIVAVFLAAAYGLPAAGFLIPASVSTILMLLGAGSGFLFLYKFLTFQSYRVMYKELFSGAPSLSVQLDNKAAVKVQQEQSYKSISGDKNITSSRRGFEYLNELFIKRHRKILWRPAKKITAVICALTAGGLMAFRIVPEFKETVNGLLMTSLPYFVLIMYFLNRGTNFTSALFINCDHSLLTYSFYKQPQFILKLFQIRLREIIKVNLLPAAVTGVGLAILLYASGGTDNPANYLILVVSILCMSIFFSVHYLMLYYLLQPYNAGTEIKSGTYQLILIVTYIVSYLLLQVKLPTLMFGIMTIVFCILYCIIASILVYRLAPKTFRIRM